MGEPDDPTLKAYYQAILHDERLKDLELHKKANIDSDQAQIVCFKDKNGPIAVFEGTQNADDIMADIEEVGLGQVGDYVERAQEFIEGLGSNVIVSGHSLGGWLAKMVTYLCDNVVYCYAFNAPDFSVETEEYLETHSKSTTDAEVRISRINNPNDTVHNINKSGKSTVDDIGNAAGAILPAHSVSTMGTMMLSSANFIRDYSEAKEQELINALRGVADTKPDAYENRNFFEQLWDNLTAFITSIINAIHDALWGSFDNMTREILETESEVHAYFERGREIDAALPGRISYLEDMIRASADEARSIMPSA